MASEVPFQAQGNSSPEGASTPNHLHKVINPTVNGNGMTIVKEEGRSETLNLNRSMSGQSELH